MSEYSYRADQALPAIPIDWFKGDGTRYDYSTGWTLSVEVALSSAKDVTIHTKTSGVAQADATSPVLIDWGATEMATIATAIGTIPEEGVDCAYFVQATRTADSKRTTFRPRNPPTFRLFAAPTPTP